MSAQLPDSASRQARPAESVQTVIRDVVDFLRLENRLVQPGMAPEERYRITLLVNQKGLRAMLAIPKPAQANGRSERWSSMHDRMRQIVADMFNRTKTRIPAPRPIIQRRLPGQDPPSYLVGIYGEAQNRMDQCYYMDRERTVKEKMDGERERAYVAAADDQERFHTEIGNALYEWGLIDWKSGYDTLASVYSDSEITGGLAREVDSQLNMDQVEEIVDRAVDKAVGDDEDDEDDWQRDPDDDIETPGAG